MQIGGCQFHEQQGYLSKSASGEVWHLPRAELQVLRLLCQNRGHLVCKRVLCEGQGEGAVLSESSIARSIYMIRSFLGPRYEYLIETVKGQGYKLLPEPEGAASDACIDARPAEVIQSRVVTTAMPGFVRISLLLMGLAALLLGLHHFLFAPKAPPGLQSSLLQTRIVDVAGGHQTLLSLHGKSRTNNGLLQQQSQTVAESLALCTRHPWDNVFLSLSHDSQVLNITMKRMHMGQSEVRNLKISDSRNPKQFVSKEWLEQERICG